MARGKRKQISVAEWRESAESVWTGLAALRALPPGQHTPPLTETTLAASSSTSPETTLAPTPKTIVDGRPTTAHPCNRRFLPHRPDSPARN